MSELKSQGFEGIFLATLPSEWYHMLQPVFRSGKYYFRGEGSCMLQSSTILSWKMMRIRSEGLCCRPISLRRKERRNNNFCFVTSLYFLFFFPSNFLLWIYYNFKDSSLCHPYLPYTPTCLVFPVHFLTFVCAPHCKSSLSHRLHPSVGITQWAAFCGVLVCSSHTESLS